MNISAQEEIIASLEARVKQLVGALNEVIDLVDRGGHDDRVDMIVTFRDIIRLARTAITPPENQE